MYRVSPQKIVILLNIASFLSWNTPKFFSCPVDAENGFKLDDWMNMKEVMEKNQPKISSLNPFSTSTREEKDFGVFHEKKEAILSRITIFFGTPCIYIIYLLQSSKPPVDTTVFSL